MSAIASSATSDPFVGRWKFNPEKSTLVDQMRVEAVGANEYLLDFGGGDERIVADGIDHPGLAGTTVSITAQASDRWKITRKMAGRTLVTGEWSLSPDGNTLRDHFTQYAADGTSSSVDYAYARTGGRASFVGSWETELKLAPFELRIDSWSGKGLSLVNVDDAHRTHNLKLDGRDYPVTGSNLIPGLTSSGRRLDARTMEITEKIKGQVSDTRRMTLSPDYRTLTMTVSPVGRNKPNILVFERE